VQVGQAQVNAPFLLDRIVRVSPFRRVFLHLPSGQFGMHGPGDRDHHIAEFATADTLSDALKLPLEELLAARNDLRGALAISRDFYEAAKWIYGNRAFGMRLAAGLSRSAASRRALLVLGFTLLKRSRYAFISSDQIADSAREAAAAKRDLLMLRKIGETDPRLAPLVTPKALRDAFSGTKEFERFQRQIIAARTR
jgi:hypothetical protein